MVRCKTPAEVRIKFSFSKKEDPMNPRYNPIDRFFFKKEVWYPFYILYLK